MPRLLLLCVALSLPLCACGGGAETETSAVAWRRVFQDLPGAIISVSGTSEEDVWAVGGNPGDGGGAYVLHFDGTAWRRLDPGVSADLWWAHAFEDGPVFLGGENGTILRYDAGTFTAMATPSNATVFGIWGPTPDDVWAVGGLPTQPGEAFVWRFDGMAWSVPSGLPSVPIASWFKVWGRAADDVRFVGMDGAILHFDGTGFSEPPAATNRRLLTIYAEPGGRWTAVGGVSSAVILEDDAAGWNDVSPATATQPMIGVRSRGDDAYAAGTAGTVLRRTSAGWVPETLGVDVYNDFHSVWIDPTGGVWVAGGDILGVPRVNGVLLHKGASPPPSTLK